MKLLLLTPPMTQINTPYPATAYLTGFLQERGFDVHQRDLSLQLFLDLFSSASLQAIANLLKGNTNPSVSFFLKNQTAYFKTTDLVLAYLQGQNPELAPQILKPGFLPRGPRFKVLAQYQAAYGTPFDSLSQISPKDKAQHLASLYIDDLADVVRTEIDPRFELSKYGEKLAASSPSFDPLLCDLQKDPSYVDTLLEKITGQVFAETCPDVVGITVPFPGNVYGALRIAKTLKTLRPDLPIVLGGGYCNTELRELKDSRVFDFVDYITLDDGERPLLSLLEFLSGRSQNLLRTLVRENNKVVMKSSSLHDIPMAQAGTPTYRGLPLKKYPSLSETLNPMHRLWTDGRWNKLTLAHGCYWKKCSFCDISLDYIGRYEPDSADKLVDKITKLVEETGDNGFHFVDEAAPPALLRALSLRLLDKKVKIRWWGNIRFEKAFTQELCELMARAGCIAVSGGLEVASDRLLDLMEKGVTVEQVARVTSAFSRAGVMVHAYLMYGFPSQTEQETIDALERVRQLFLWDCIQSGFWHRFSATVHSPVAMNPTKYGIKLLPQESTFAKNDVEFLDSTGVDHDRYQPGLKKAIYNFMHGVGLEEDVRTWFDIRVPKPKVPKDLVAKALGFSHKGSIRA